MRSWRDQRGESYSGFARALAETEPQFYRRHAYMGDKALTQAWIAKERAAIEQAITEFDEYMERRRQEANARIRMMAHDLAQALMGGAQ